MAASNSGSRPPACSRMIAVFLKEFREIFRDRRTVVSVIVSPLLITPAMFFMLGMIIHGESKKESARVYDVGVIGAEASPDLYRAVSELPQVSLRQVSRPEAESQIAGHKMNVAIVLPAGTDALARDFKPVPVEVLLDAGDESSQSAASRLSIGLSKIGEHVVASRLKKQGLSPDFASPFKISQTPIKSGGSMVSLMLATMLPYLLVVSSFGGAIYASFDQVAGEKERGTLETLLVSPATRREIVLGKFLAVALVCIISSILSVTGVIISFSLPGSMFTALSSNGGLHLSAAAICVSMLMMLPLAFLFAGVLLAVSTFARNQKEAQTYITPILLLVMVPVMISIFVHSDIPRYMGLVPVLGTSIIIKQAFSGLYDPAFIALAFTSSLVYGAAAIGFAVSLFEKESVLIKA
jgi:sodium transport system permease protein